ncbi:glutaredoxin family protein [Massilia sp. ST3]|uniref:glutaredoxin family protein n=1 Tax=Massilia sp. ST3 TaxID=2824903 RepID=UPI001B8431DA|nr:glutaredoxin family protein [Massilia sp. ST3]MBQ5947435.1 glutaredoxin family protein [Massilia sp. ST3]
MEAIPFTLYSRVWCHLCEDMLAALKALEQPGRPFAITVLDVDADPALEARFDELVPVLYGDPDGEELCHYFLDREKVEAYIAAQIAEA